MDQAIPLIESRQDVSETHQMVRYVVLVKRSSKVKSDQSENYKKFVEELKKFPLPDVSNFGEILGTLPSERGEQFMSIVSDRLYHYFND